MKSNKLLLIFQIILMTINVLLSEEIFNKLVKRQENNLQAIQNCLDNFDIHEDNIIRTQDSRAMGAKYLNEKDVVSRRDCLKLCCETKNCDVFVFEEETPGSCYLFECGTPDNFKCKFTKHKNYTSAVYAANRRMSELETQIKFTQHEHELSQLREPLKSSIATVTVQPKNQETLQLVPSEKTTREHRCNRYQFECHTPNEADNYECIAIYNVCDGIPQCKDASDEAAELACPTQSSVVDIHKEVVVTIKPREENNFVGENNFDLTSVKKSNPEEQHTFNKLKPNQWIDTRQYIEKVPDGYEANNKYYQNQLASNSRTNYGREGEGLIYQNQQIQQQQEWPYHSNNGNTGQIFNHKGNGLISQNNRYIERYPHQNMHDSSQGQSAQYYEPNEYNSKYSGYYDPSTYRTQNGYQQNAPYNWQSGPRQNDVSVNVADDVYLNNNPNNKNNVPQQDYYYEEYYRNRNQQQSPGTSQIQSQGIIQHKEKPAIGPLQKVNEILNRDNKEHAVQNKINSLNVTTLSTSKPKENLIHEKHVVASHSKMEKISVDVSFKESAFENNQSQEHNDTPSGAILSLTFGMLVSAIMITIIGCRIRTVRRRLRRGGKSYAHDADFLVNGMYL